jgi:hypothetical protein
MKPKGMNSLAWRIDQQTIRFAVEDFKGGIFVNPFLPKSEAGRIWWEVIRQLREKDKAKKKRLRALRRGG